MNNYDKIIYGEALHNLDKRIIKLEQDNATLFNLVVDLQRMIFDKLTPDSYAKITKAIKEIREHHI